MSNFTLSQCPEQSAGFGAQLILSMTQAMWATQLICSISPPEMWPKDYGETAVKEGIP